MTMNKKQLFVLGSIILIVFLAHTCWAGSTTANMTVSANVVQDCTITANGLSFPDYSGAADVTAESTLELNCSPTLPYTIDLDQGDNYGTSTAGNRGLNAGVYGVNLKYQLYKDAAHQTIWGTFFSGGESFSATGSGTAQTHTVYGLVLAGQYPDAGAYTDSITVTVTW